MPIIAGWYDQDFYLYRKASEVTNLLNTGNSIACLLKENAELSQRNQLKTEYDRIISWIRHFSSLGLFYCDIRIESRYIENIKQILLSEGFTISNDCYLDSSLVIGWGTAKEDTVAYPFYISSMENYHRVSLEQYHAVIQMAEEASRQGEMCIDFDRDVFCDVVEYRLAGTWIFPKHYSTGFCILFFFLASILFIAKLIVAPVVILSMITTFITINSVFLTMKKKKVYFKYREDVAYSFSRTTPTGKVSYIAERHGYAIHIGKYIFPMEIDRYTRIQRMHCPDIYQGVLTAEAEELLKSSGFRLEFPVMQRSSGPFIEKRYNVIVRWG